MGNNDPSPACLEGVQIQGSESTSPLSKGVLRLYGRVCPHQVSHRRKATGAGFELAPFQLCISIVCDFLSLMRAPLSFSFS